MKKTRIIIICLLIVVAIGLFFLQGEENTHNKDLWKDALYTENTTLGTGKNTLIVTIQAGDKAINFTVKTDKTIVGDALKEHKLIDGEEGLYGLYVKLVNGIEADYDKDQSYWAFTKGGQSMQTGVDSAKFKDGEHYELVYTK